MVCTIIYIHSEWKIGWVAYLTEAQQPTEIPSLTKLAKARRATVKSRFKQQKQQTKKKNKEKNVSEPLAKIVCNNTVKPACSEHVI